MNTPCARTEKSWPIFSSSVICGRDAHMAAKNRTKSEVPRAQCPVPRITEAFYGARGTVLLNNRPNGHRRRDSRILSGVHVDVFLQRARLRARAVDRHRDRLLPFRRQLA